MSIRRESLLRAGQGSILAAFGADPVADPRRQALQLWTMQKAYKSKQIKTNENRMSGSNANQRVLRARSVNVAMVSPSASTTSLSTATSSTVQSNKRMPNRASKSLKKLVRQTDVFLPQTSVTLSTQTELPSFVDSIVEMVPEDSLPILRSVMAAWRSRLAISRANNRLVLQRAFFAWRSVHAQQQSDTRECQLHQHVLDLEGQLSQMRIQMQANEVLRRKLHQQVQDSRGAIRVMARLRPPRPDRISSDGLTIATSTDCVGHEIVLHGASKIHKFTVDHIFGPNDDQATVFALIADLVQSSCDGYNVNLFAYGATNSGKTYTLVNPANMEGCDQARGIMGRAVDALFVEAARLQEQFGTIFSICVSYVEIYNDVVFDLFNDSHKLDLRITSDGSTYCKNLQRVSVASAASLHEMMARAQENRSFRETQFNERSSRSHCIFQVWLESTTSSVSGSSVMSFVDLAGSESLANSDSKAPDPDSIKETLHINRSLSSLGTCIQALASSAPFVPYRDSKLTHLMSDALGGQSKTLFLVTLSPEQDDTAQSIASLRFATNLRAVQRGRTTRKNTSINRARSTSRV